MDNHLEDYHVPVAHPGLLRPFDYQSYTVTKEADGFTLFEVRCPMSDLAATVFPVRRYPSAYPSTYFAKMSEHHTKFACRLNIHIGCIADDEGDELVARSRPGPVTPGYRPEPLSRREALAGCSHRQIRRDPSNHHDGPDQCIAPALDTHPSPGPGAEGEAAA